MRRRREDVCWGKTYDEVRRANGDTYHTTNCTPQVAGFNQSSKHASGESWKSSSRTRRKRKLTACSRGRCSARRIGGLPASI